MRLKYVMEADKALYKTCCSKFFKCGFCYDTPDPAPIDKCPAII